MLSSKIYELKLMSEITIRYSQATKLFSQMLTIGYACIVN